ncbi:PREDICTED: uncharacterized protein LOC107337491 isoform X3 [Acropora digitifera]|nr:PREDICTED: uncharacterized protein LOC107337491 isoform X3 [Acropora digitifera]XP_015758150.1 PREDICTED: uncharacterized protein LOC107337491 isoform X3 [Acropora digitifera]XP_015758151.1 PREDICTED: uncharacterized protein LOC107337491 isoform X3 [Acropora digitifera]XP_015758152.1 PREDICTED: uncharacterized protein LOC107337491 isoform X3 [Acropora digitifera]
MFRGWKPKDASKAPNIVRYIATTLSSLSPKRVHVTFGESKRVLCFSEEDEVGQLRQKFLQAFSDSLADDIAVANVRFQQYDHTFKEYVDLENEVKLEHNAKVKAAIVSSREKKEPGRGGDLVPLTVNLKVSLDDLLDALPQDVRYHIITQQTPYRLWNLVSNGLIQPNNDVPPVVTCSGQFGDTNTVIKAKFYGRNNSNENVFYLTMDPSGSDMYLTPKGKNQEITLEPTESDDALFVPRYYYGFTAFRSQTFDSLYLGCDNNKSGATLVEMKDVNYPNPQALFTVNIINLDVEDNQSFGA